MVNFYLNPNGNNSHSYIIYPEYNPNTYLRSDGLRYRQSTKYIKKHKHETSSISASIMKEEDDYDHSKFKYLWMYKALILEYFSRKGLKMPTKTIYDSLYNGDSSSISSSIIKEDQHKFKVEITGYIPFIVRVNGLGKSPLFAEYAAYYNLYNKIIKEHTNMNDGHNKNKKRDKLIDSDLMNELINEYIRYDNLDCDHRKWKDWWYSGNNSSSNVHGNNKGDPKLNILDFFMNIYKYSDSYKCNDIDRAGYLLHENTDFETKFAVKWTLNSGSRNGHRFNGGLDPEEIMMLWYNAICYLFPIKRYQDHEMKNDIPRDRDGNIPITKSQCEKYRILLNERKDLLLFLCQHFYFRRQFFENIPKMGFLKALDIMKVNHL